MFDSEQIHPSHNSIRRVEKELTLSNDHEQEIIDDLVDTIDELRIFSAPIATERIIEDVPLEDTTLPKRYNLLNMTQAMLHDGSYKTKITLPGCTLTLEGTRIEESGAWRRSVGNTEEQPLEHTDAIPYLQAHLKNLSSLESLKDTASISDATMIEALWNDLAPLAGEWKDASYYTTAVDHYTPSLIEIAPNVAAVVGHIETSSSNKYVCRLGTQLPIDLSTLGEQQSKQKASEVHEEYRFSVEFPKRTDRFRKALAFYAIESDHLTTGRLHDLADATILYAEDIPAVYEKATTYIKAKHLDMSSFLDE
jgi:hypothetical protein